MDKIKVLFVCSANKDRSKTAEDYFSSLKEFAPFEFNSAGTNISLCNKIGTNPITAAQISDADIIIVMETKHKDYVYSLNLPLTKKKLYTLNIQDVYTYFEPKLIEIFINKITPILNRENSF